MKVEPYKNSEIIKALAENKHLVLFSNDFYKKETEDYSAWGVVERPSLVILDESKDLFLCLPQHNENGQCLHWLNGGELYINNGKGLGEGNYTLSIKRNNPLADFIGHPEYQFRIKPKKEKRWIGCYPSAKVTPISFASIDEVKNYVSKNSLYTHCAPEAWEFIEIEVEV